MTKIRRKTVGWREWVALPELGLHAVKAKIDTGARTSALHAFQLETFYQQGVRKVRFAIHPLRKRRDLIIECSADIVDQRTINVVEMNAPAVGVVDQVVGNCEIGEISRR